MHLKVKNQVAFKTLCDFHLGGVGTGGVYSTPFQVDLEVSFPEFS